MCSAEGTSSKDTEEAPSTSATIAAIKAHPLYPVLELLQRKCDLATSSLSPEAFQMDDVTELIRSLKKTHSANTVRTDSAEVDALVQQAIVSLRIHLVELQKVRHLCDEFKRKYIDAIQKTHGRSEFPASDTDSADDESEEQSPAQVVQHGDASRNSVVAPFGVNKVRADRVPERKCRSTPVTTATISSTNQTEASDVRKSARKSVDTMPSDCDTSTGYSISRLLK
ncbi:Protein PSA-3 b [Aphelenchoides avenae]|nr:Protein PSA-3 b [Aphelenchus avenae]